MLCRKRTKRGSIRPSSLSPRISEKPMIELSGVRSSWLMLARNWLLARLASRMRTFAWASSRPRRSSSPVRRCSSARRVLFSSLSAAICMRRSRRLGDAVDHEVGAAEEQREPAAGESELVVQPLDLAHADEQERGRRRSSPAITAERGAAPGDEGGGGRVGQEPDEPERRGVADEVDRPAGEADVADHPGDVEPALGLGALRPPLQEHEDRHRGEAERAGDRRRRRRRTRSTPVIQATTTTPAITSMTPRRLRCTARLYLVALASTGVLSAAPDTRCTLLAGGNGLHSTHTDGSPERRRNGG